MANASKKNPNSIRYTVVPTDPTNATKIAQTEALLKNMDSSAEVIPKSTPDGTSVWFLKSNNVGLEEVLTSLGGVSLVERDASSNHIRRDVLKCIASATESGNIKETEEFLASKIQSGTEYRRILDDDETTVLGWDDLALDEEAVLRPWKSTKASNTLLGYKNSHITEFCPQRYETELRREPSKKMRTKPS